MAAMLAVAAAGCGSESTSTNTDETAATAQFELLITRDDKQGRLVLRGRYDYVRRQGFLTTKLEDTDDSATDVPTEVRFFGERSYAEMTYEGKTYWKVDQADAGVGYPDEAIIPFPGGEVDARESLRLILAAGDEQKRGREEVRGADTTRYRVELDPEDVSRELGGRPFDQAVGRFEADVWADDAERVRRIRIHETEGTLTYDFYDFGVAVDVERPPEEQVLSQKEFDCLLEPTADCGPMEKK
jgi:hypothetical protein